MTLKTGRCKALGHDRISTDQQVGEHHASLETQEAHIRYCVTNTGGHWVSASVQVILRHPVINGTMVYGRRGTKKVNPDKQELARVEGVFPKILSDEEWTALQQRLDIRSEHSRGAMHEREHLLSGILRCGHCGGPIIRKMTSTYTKMTSTYTRTRIRQVLLLAGGSLAYVLRLLQHAHRFETRSRRLASVTSATNGFARSLCSFTLGMGQEAANGVWSVARMPKTTRRGLSSDPASLVVREASAVAEAGSSVQQFSKHWSAANPVRAQTVAHGARRSPC